MAFRWFKRHEKKFLFFLVIVVVPTFGISYGVFSYFGGGRARTQAAATFELVRGEKTVVPLQEIQADSARTRINQDRELIWHLALREESKLAGIGVSNEELRETITSSLRQAFPSGYTFQEYKDLLARNGLSVADFEGSMREQLTIGRLNELKASDRRILAESVYKMYARENTRMTLDVVKFPAAEFEEEISIFDFEPSDVETFYKRIQENPDEYGWCRDRYLIPEMVTLETIRLEFADVDPEANASVLATDTPPSEDEMRNYYALHSSWFVREPVEEESSEAQPSEEEGDETESEEKPPVLSESIPFEEVRDAIRTRILVERGFERLLGELRVAKDQGQIVDLAAKAGEMGLTYEKLEDVPVADLPTLDSIGHEGIAAEFEGLQAGDYSRTVGKGRKDGVYLFRIVRHDPEAFEPLSQVEVMLRDDMVKDKSVTECQNAARDFFQEIKTGFEEMVKAERGEGDKTEGDPAEDETKTPEELTQERQMEQAEINAQRYRMREVFTKLVQEKGLEVSTFGPRTFLRPGTADADEVTDPAERYLFAARVVQSLEAGQVEGRLLYDKNERTAYVVAAVSKEEPTPEEMSQEDFDEFRQMMVFRQVQLQRGYQTDARERFLNAIHLEGFGAEDPRRRGTPQLPFDVR